MVATEMTRPNVKATEPIALRPEVAFRIPDTPRWGPARRRYLLRTAFIANAVIALGLVLIFAVGGHRATATGLSLIIPGGGFLYDAWPLLFVATWAAWFLAWNLWIGFGAFAHVLGVYLLALGASIALAEGPRLGLASGVTWRWAIPVLLAGGALYALRHLIKSELSYSRGLKQRQERNAYLAKVDPEVKASVLASFAPAAPTQSAPRPGAPRRPVLVTQEDGALVVAERPPARERPLADADAALAKWLLKLAIQPLDKFDRWDWKPGPFYDSALRYQLNGVGQALAYFQANYVPAYPSLYGQAQRNVIEKMQNRQVWGFWWGENLVGNLKFNPDPIAGGHLDNIMFSGFFALHLAHFEAATHDHRYDQPGAFRFVWRDGRIFSYSYKDIVEYCSKCFAESDYTLWPCEPNQIYMACNQRGAAGVAAYDALHGTNYWGRVKEKYAKALDENFMTHAGDYYGITNARLGMNLGSLTWNDGTGPTGGQGNGSIVSGGRTMTPEVAARLFLIDKNHELWSKLPIQDDVLRLPPPPKPPEKKGLFDLGYYRRLVPTPQHLISGAWVDVTQGTGWNTSGPFQDFALKPASNAMKYAGIASLAGLYGNRKLADAAIRGLDEECFLGVDAPRPFDDRVMTVTAICAARWCAPYNQDDLLQARVPHYKGPILASAPYPEVLVTRAKGQNGILELTVEPAEGSGRFPLTFEKLLPNREYYVDGDGARFTTDSYGLGQATVALARRTFLTIRPVG